MGKFWLSVSYLAIQIHLVTAATRNTPYWHDSEFDNAVCTATNAIPDFKEVQSKMQCLAQCNEKDDCNSIFYKDGSCLLSNLSRSTMTSSVCQSVVGYKLYHRGCTSEYVLNAQARTCFRVYTERKTWQDARAVCQSEGADLLVLKNKNFFQSHTLEGYYIAWVGYTDAEQEGTWKWVDGSQTNLWYPGNPYIGNSRHCAVDHGLFPTILQDRNCNETRTFLCGYQI